jgi:predicted phosphodiesterase
MSLEKWLIVPDVHIPYESKKSYALMLRAAQAIKVQNICVLGDFADFYAVSSHTKDPSRKADLQWEVNAVTLALDELDRIFKGKKKFIQGNHEQRLERYLADKAPALFDTVKCERLFRFKERGWEYTPYKQHTKIGKLHLTHDCGKAGPNAHIDAMNAFQSNAIIGHTHRMGYAVQGNAKGEPHVGAMLGWLGDIDQTDYMYRVRACRDWAHGFGIAYVEKNGNTHLQPVPIVGGRVLIEGKLVR